MEVSYFSLAFPTLASYNIWIGKSKPMEVSIGLFYLYKERQKGMALST